MPCSATHVLNCAGLELTCSMGVDVVQGELPALHLKYFRSLPAKEGLGKI